MYVRGIVNQFRHIYHLNSVNLPTHEHFPFIYIFFNFFHWCFVVFGIQVLNLLNLFLFYYFWCYCKWNCFSHFILACPMLVYRNTVDFCILILYPLLNASINFSFCVCGGLLRIFYMHDHVTWRDTFTSFPIGIISFLVSLIWLELPVQC